MKVQSLQMANANPCPYHAAEWDRATQTATLALVNNVKVIGHNLMNEVKKKVAAEWYKEKGVKAKHGAIERSAFSVQNGKTLPAFAIPMRLYHYKRSHVECKWKKRVQLEKGSIFDHNNSKRLVLINTKCTEEETSEKFIVNKDPNRPTDHTLGNAAHVRAIYAMIEEMFGPKGTRILFMEQVGWRYKLKHYMETDSFVF
jgi:hypothetical protein